MQPHIKGTIPEKYLKQKERVELKLKTNFKEAVPKPEDYEVHEKGEDHVGKGFDGGDDDDGGEEGAEGKKKKKKMGGGAAGG